MEASKLVSDAILGSDLKYFSVGGKVYGISPPSIKTILRVISHLSKVRLTKEQYTQMEILGEYHNLRHFARALAVIIRRKDGWRTKRLSRKLLKGTVEEITQAFAMAVGLMGGSDFFALAQLAKNIRKMAATPK